MNEQDERQKLDIEREAHEAARGADEQARAQEEAKVAADWGDSQKMQVLCAVYKHSEAVSTMACPVCDTMNLRFQKDGFQMAAWCSNCRTGIESKLDGRKGVELVGHELAPDHCVCGLCNCTNHPKHGGICDDCMDDCHAG